MFPLPFPIARLLRGSSYLVLSSTYSEVCGRSVRRTAILSGPSHSAHCPWLVLQASEPGTSDEVLPADDRTRDLHSATQSAFRPPVCMGLAAGGSSCCGPLSIGISVYLPRVGLPSLWVQEWVRDFPSLL